MLDSMRFPRVRDPSEVRNVHCSRSQGSQWCGLAYVRPLNVVATLAHLMRQPMRHGTLHAAICALRHLVLRLYALVVFPVHNTAVTAVQHCHEHVV